jgi:hypothetical protein
MYSDKILSITIFSAHFLCIFQTLIQKQKSLVDFCMMARLEIISNAGAQMPSYGKITKGHLVCLLANARRGEKEEQAPAFINILRRSKKANTSLSPGAIKYTFAKQ